MKENARGHSGTRAQRGECVVSGSRKPDRHAGEDLVEVHVPGGPCAQLVLPRDDVAPAASPVRGESGRVALVARVDVRGLEGPEVGPGGDLWSTDFRAHCVAPGRAEFAPLAGVAV